MADAGELSMDISTKWDAGLIVMPVS